MTGPAANLDAEISRLLGSIPGTVDKAIEVQQAAVRFKIFKKLSQGNLQHNLLHCALTHHSVKL